MPKIVDKEEMRNRIRHGALAAFARQGYHGTTMESVARETGIAKGTLYLYFKSKEDLATHMVDAHLERMRTAFMTESAASDSLQALSDELYRIVDISDEHARFIPVFFESFGPSFGNAALLKRMADFFDDLGAYYAERLELLRAEGLIGADVDANAVGRALVGMMDGLTLHRGMFGVAKSRHQAMARAAIACLLNGLAPR